MHSWYNENILEYNNYTAIPREERKNLSYKLVTHAEDYSIPGNNFRSMYMYIERIWFSQNLSSYQRLEAKKALIGTTHVAYLPHQVNNLEKGLRNWEMSLKEKSITYISNVILTGVTTCPFEEKVRTQHKMSCKKTKRWKGFSSHTLNTRTRKNATSPENPIWIMVSVIGNGKLKYFCERTHYKRIR